MAQTIQSRAKGSLLSLCIYAGLFCGLFSALGAAICILRIHPSASYAAVKAVLYLLTGLIFPLFGLSYGILLWATSTLSRLLRLIEETARGAANAAGILASSVYDGTAAGTILSAVINGLIIVAALISARKLAWAGTQLAAVKFLITAIRAVLHILAFSVAGLALWAVA